MVKNYIKTAWRNICKRKFHSFINLIGLVSSMVFVLLIIAYIDQAYQVNKGIRNIDRQYVLQSEYREPGIGMELTTIGALPQALKEEYPNLVANYYRIDGLTGIVSNGDQVYEENLSLGDSTFLHMFGFRLLHGDPLRALADPLSVVITETAAMKYFGKTDVIDQTLTIRNFGGDKQDFKVTGVLASTATNSVMELTPAMQANIFLPRHQESYFGREINNWDNLWIASFIELQEGVRPEQLDQPIRTLLKQHVADKITKNLTAKLKPLDSYYLDDNQGAVRQLIQALSITATFLIVMAIINFVNFTIGQSMTRLKEMGVRKIIGSSKSQVMYQLLIEYGIIVVLAGTITIACYPLLSPIFASIMGQTLPSFSQLSVSFFGYFALATILLGLIAGIYPAIKLADNDILSAVKNKLSNFSDKNYIHRILLFLQFTIASIVLISSIIVSRQVNTFIRGNLGYNKDYLLTAQVPRDWSAQGLKHMEWVQQELKNLPEVQDISLSYSVPGSMSDDRQQIRKQGTDKSVAAQLLMTDEHFAKAYQVPLIAGSFFDAYGKPLTDSSKVVINKKAAQSLGYEQPEQAIGQQINFFDGRFIGTITGVTDDFFANTMHSAVPPTVYFSTKASKQYRFLSIRLKAGSVNSAMTTLQQKWKQLMPDAPFEPTFMDETIHKMYKTELQLQRASQTATVISVIIVVLGIVGLTSLSLNLRLKELGIRKVLGASLPDLVKLLSKDFYVTFILSVLVSLPATYLLTNYWLSNYAVRTDISLGIFILPIAILGLLLLAFIATLIFRSTRQNPVLHLRE